MGALSVLFLVIGVVCLYNVWDNLMIILSYYTYTTTRPVLKVIIYFISALLCFYIGIITY